MERLSQNLIETAQPISGVEFPNYDRNEIKEGWVHIGTGNFFRAHAADDLHQLMQSGDKDALNYGITTVSLRTPGTHRAMAAQDGLYTVAEQDRDGLNKMTVVGSIVKSMYAPDDTSAVVRQIASPDTRIVSMTITPDVHQSYVDANGFLNFKNEDIAHDLAPANEPRTVPGYLARAIMAREASGLPALTVLNLDNMVHNGDAIGSVIKQFALTFGGDELAEAIEVKYKFPNSMVDRIVPKTTPELLEQVSAKTGMIDEAAVPTEPRPEIGHLVIEDDFANGRPALEKVGAMFVPDVAPYEKAKLRLLNVTHSMIACLGDLEGKTLIDQDMNDPLFVEAVATLMKNETGPTLPEVPGVDLEAYKAEIIARFANEKVRDTNQRVATDAPLAVVLDTVRDQLAAGGSYELLALNTAAWIRRFAVDKNQTGGDIVTKHAVKDQLIAAARTGKNEPNAVFALTGVFGDLGQEKQFVAAVRAYMHMLDKEGVRATLAQAVENSKVAVQRNTTPAVRPQTTSAPDLSKR